MSMTTTDFDYLRQLVRDESAIVLEPGKEYLFESRLQPLAKRHGLTDINDLVRRLRTGAGDLRGLVVDAMTTNETSWFRDRRPWDVLRDTLLPELLAARGSASQVVVWCGASSSGQEPYSLALLLREHFPDACRDRRVRIVATDLSPSMLERSRAGRYSQLEVGRGLPAPMLARWFSRHGVEWALDDEIRSMVEYRPLNLADRSTWGIVSGALDLVLLRNVLIYFDVRTKVEILTGVRARLRDEGVLLLGSSETTLGLVDCFDRTQAGSTIYYRPRSGGL
jgi:chemotaxis protein methyltransferase CheR